MSAAGLFESMVNIGARVPVDRAHDALGLFTEGTLGKVLVTR